MRCKPTLVAATALLLLAGQTAPARAADLAAEGRRIFNQDHNAVVTLEIVLKTTYTRGGQASTPAETKHDATGTVLNPSGLTVLSLSACDPGELLRRMMSDRSGYKVETEVDSVNILLADGTELPAEIVLRDKDLDLAFVRPKTKPAKPMAAVDLAKSGSAQVLDEVIALNRLNRAASRAYSATVERISAVVEKPRKFYVPDSMMTTTTLGSPAFLPDGKVLGIFVMRAIGEAGGGTYNSQQNLASIIVPAADVLKAARQAPEARGAGAPGDGRQPAKTNAPAGGTADK